jgi:hypothetical protein
VANTAIESKDGAHLKGNGYEISATDRTISRILDTVETIWRDSLIWTERNPISFVFVLIFLLTSIGIRTIGKIRIQAMKQEYEERRSAVRKGRPVPIKRSKEMPNG